MGNWGIRKKYFIGLFIIVILPIVIIGIALYSGYKGVILEHFSYKSKEVLKNIGNQIESESRNNSLILSSIVKEKIYIDGEYLDICDLITRWNKTNDIGERYKTAKLIDNVLDGVLNYANNIESIVFYLKDNSFYFYRNYPTVDSILIREEEWYKRSLENKGVIYTVNSSNDETIIKSEGDILSNSIGIGEFNNNDVELIYMATKTNIFKQLYSEKGNHIGSTFILDSDNNIISATNNTNMTDILDQYSSSFEESDTIFNYDNEAFIVSNIRIPKLEWTILNFVSYKELMKDISEINFIAIVIFIAIISSFIIFSLMFFKGIVNPIQILIADMRKVKLGALNVSVKVERDDEIGELSRNFNSMVKDIKRLIDENSQKEREKAELEIEALQAQINPHFISNTLNAIRFMAMIAKVNSIKEMTEAFINITSASFKRDSKFTTLEKEFETLKNYVYIMRVRHGNKYDVFFELDDEVRNNRVLKMLIQPILENSIIHGVSGLEKSGNIFVKAYKDDEDVVIEIEDDGVGMEKEKINILLAKDCRNENGFTSIGVRNVDKRIKINYGKKYGIEIKSELGIGTTIRLKIPISKRNGEDLDV